MRLNASLLATIIMAEVELPAPPIHLPPAVWNGVINCPPQPNVPPSDEDLWRATSYEMQVLEAYCVYNIYLL
jgi:hypothetical protein